MPALRAVEDQHIGRGRNGPPNGAFVDQSAAGLNSSAQNGVGSTADFQMPFFCLTQDAEALRGVEGKGFSQSDMLSRAESGQVEGGVGLRHCKIENGVNIRPIKKVANRTGRRNAMPHPPWPERDPESRSAHATISTR